MKTYSYEELLSLPLMTLAGGHTRAFTGHITSRILRQLGVKHKPEDLYKFMVHIDVLDPKRNDLTESVTSVIEDICEADNIGPVIMERYIFECYRVKKGMIEYVPDYVRDAVKDRFADFVMPALDLYAKILAEAFN